MVNKQQQNGGIVMCIPASDIRLIKLLHKTSFCLLTSWRPEISPPVSRVTKVQSVISAFFPRWLHSCWSTKHKQIHPKPPNNAAEGGPHYQSPAFLLVCCPPLWHHVGFTQGPKVNSHTEMTQTLQNRFKIRKYRQRAGSSLLHSVIIFLFTGKKKHAAL